MLHSTFLRSALSVCFVVWFGLSISRAVNAQGVETIKPMSFSELPLPAPATWMEMSDDGKLLVFGHENEDQVSIYDVEQRKVITSILTASPRNVLIRGERIIVSSPRTNAIRKYIRRHGNEWELERKFELPRPGLVHVAAAGTKAFRGDLLLTFHGEGSSGSYRDNMIVNLDLRGRFNAIRRGALGTVSYDGRMMIRQESFNLSPAGKFHFYDYAASKRMGDRAQEYFSCAERGQTSYVYQVYPAPYWIARDAMYGGNPMARLPGDWGNLILVDRTKKLAYVIADSTMTCRDLNSRYEPVWQRRLEYPEPFSEMRKLRPATSGNRGYYLDHQEAVTLGGRTYMFIRTAVDGIVLTAEMEPIAIDPTPNNRDMAGRKDAKPRNAVAPAKPVFRDWTSKDGSYSVNAMFVRIDGANIVLHRKETNKEISVPLNRLSADDIDIAKQYAAAEMPALDQSEINPNAVQANPDATSSFLKTVPKQ